MPYAGWACSLRRLVFRMVTWFAPLSQVNIPNSNSITKSRFDYQPLFGKWARAPPEEIEPIRKVSQIICGHFENWPLHSEHSPKVDHSWITQTFLAINFREEFRLTVDPQQRGEARPWPLILLLFIYNKEKTRTVVSSSATSPLPWKNSFLFQFR